MTDGDVLRKIRQAIAEQASWEGYDIPDGRLSRLAENVFDSLELTEFTCSGPAERYWSTAIQRQDENGEWQWPNA